MSSNKKLIIFDLGGVVFWHTFANALRFWAVRGGSTFEKVRSLYSHDEMYARHEVDQISIAAYKEHVCSVLEIQLSLDDFVAGWNSIFLSEVKGIRGLLETLGRDHLVVALSNTNFTHCEFVKSRFKDVFSLFEKIYFSHEIGCRKPHREAFETVLNGCGAAPSDAVFLDDLPENLEGARKLGIATIHVKDFPSTLEGLRREGLFT